MALSPELEAVKDAMDKSTGDGRDHAYAVELSVAYIKAHPELTAEMHDWDIPKIVAAVDALRAAGLEEQHWQCEAYLLAKFPPQNIGGEYHVEAKLPEL